MSVAWAYKNGKKKKKSHLQSQETEYRLVCASCQEKCIVELRMGKNGS